MGAVFRPKDSRRDHNKKILENAINDLSSDTKDNDQITILGKKGMISREKAMRSGEKLKEILDN